MDQKLHEKHVFLMIFDGGLTIVWSKMLRLYWHARHSMSNYRSNLKKNQSFNTRGHRLKVPEWIKNCVSARKMLVKMLVEMVEKSLYIFVANDIAMVFFNSLYFKEFRSFIFCIVFLEFP